MKRGSPWTAPAMPDIRAALRRGFVELIERHSAALVDDPDLRSVRNPAQLRRRNNLAETLDEMRTEVQALDRAGLYWVARDMVPVVMAAAQTLPEWTPELVLPSETGMLCWAKPAGDIPRIRSGQGRQVLIHHAPTLWPRHRRAAVIRTGHRQRLAHRSVALRKIRNYAIVTSKEHETARLQPRRVHHDSVDHWRG